MPKYQPSQFNVPERHEIARISRTVTSTSGTGGTGPAGPPEPHHATHEPGGSDALRLTASSRVLGRATSGAGAVEELTIGDNLYLTGTTLSAASRNSAFVNYTYSAATTAPPGADQIRFDAGAPYTAVTKVWIRTITADGQDVYRGLLIVPMGSTLLVQDKNDHAQYVQFTTTGAPVDFTTYIEFPVVHQAHGSSLGGGQLVIVQNTGGNLPGGGTISQLTGDVTAGPGTGSQVATIAADAVTYAKLQNVSAASRLLGRGSASGSGDAQEITLGTNLSMTGTTLDATGGGSLTTQQKTRAITVIFGTGSAAIAAGLKTFVSCPYTGTITAARLLAVDAAVTSGSVVIDVWKATYAAAPPTVANTITASAKPTLSGATKSEDTTLTGWTTAVTAGDVFGFVVDSASLVTQVALQLTIVVT